MKSSIEAFSDIVQIPEHVVGNYATEVSSTYPVFSMWCGDPDMQLLGYEDREERRVALLFDDLIDANQYLTRTGIPDGFVHRPCLLNIAVLTRPYLARWEPRVNKRRIRKSKEELTLTCESFDVGPDHAIPAFIGEDYQHARLTYPAATAHEFEAAMYLFGANKCHRVGIATEAGELLAAISVLDNGNSMHAILYANRASDEVKRKHSLGTLAHLAAVDIFKDSDRRQIDFGVYYAYKGAFDFEHRPWGGLCLKT